MKIKHMNVTYTTSYTNPMFCASDMENENEKEKEKTDIKLCPIRWKLTVDIYINKRCEQFTYI